MKNDGIKPSEEIAPGVTLSLPEEKDELAEEILHNEAVRLATAAQRREQQRAALLDLVKQNLAKGIPLVITGEIIELGLKDECIKLAVSMSYGYRLAKMMSGEDQQD